MATPTDTQPARLLTARAALYSAVAFVLAMTWVAWDRGGGIAAGAVLLASAATTVASAASIALDELRARRRE